MESPKAAHKSSSSKFLKKRKVRKATFCGFRRHSPKIPPIIEQTCSYLEQNALQHEGIFRISGSQESIRQIKDKFEKGKKVDLTKELNPNTVAGVLKLFFTELPNPIMTYELYPALISAVSIEEVLLRVWCLRQVMDVMPPGNREVIRRVSAMFRTISAFEEVNKMSARNIAIVMNPALFRDPLGSISDFVKNGGIRVRLVETFITYHNQIFMMSRSMLDESIRALGDIQTQSELKLLSFSQILQQNAILLATALMNEGETEMAVCFDNFNNIHKSLDSWRRDDAEQNEESQNDIVQHEEIIAAHNDGEQHEIIDIVEETKQEPEEIVVRKRITSRTRRKKSGSAGSFQLNDPENPMHDGVQITLRRRKPRRKRRESSTDSYKYSAPEAGRSSMELTDDDEMIKLKGCTPRLGSLTPRSSVKLFFDPRNTNAIANEGDVDIGGLFKDVVDGKPELMREKLNKLSPEARFLLIFRLQRAAQNFIVALDECKE